MLALLAQVSAAEHVASPPAFQADPTAGDRLQRGATQLQVLKEEAARKGEAGAPQASCWAAAVGKLESGCAQVAKDDDVQSRLAVEFTNCHLAKSGLPTYECTPAMTLQDCTRPMVDSASGLAYSTYTLFYTHTESICFYMQSQAFQASTEAAVNSLHAAGIEAASRLQGLQHQAAEIGGRAAEILSEQAAAAAAQQALLQGQRQAREELSGLQQAQAASFAAAESALGALGAQSRSALEELKKDTTELSLKGKRRRPPRTPPASRARGRRALRPSVAPSGPAVSQLTHAHRAAACTPCWHCRLRTRCTRAHPPRVRLCAACWAASTGCSACRRLCWESSWTRRPSSSTRGQG